MTKNISHISSRIVCPKCQTKNLRKAIPSLLGREYFCDKDHEYFGIAELVNEWSYDVADFYSEDDKTQLTMTEWLRAAWHVEVVKEKPITLLIQKNRVSKSGSVGFSPDAFEGEWSSETARDEAYEVVNRMLAGIEELEWNFDARDLPYPIGTCGGC